MSFVKRGRDRDAGRSSQLIISLGIFSYVGLLPSVVSQAPIRTVAVCLLPRQPWANGFEDRLAKDHALLSKSDVDIELQLFVGFFIW
ncbi:MAG TPA: hypothetical protein VGM65_13970 [Candidatus Udaeobacter sp.]